MCHRYYVKKYKSGFVFPVYGVGLIINAAVVECRVNEQRKPLIVADESK